MALGLCRKRAHTKTHFSLATAFTTGLVVKRKFLSVLFIAGYMHRMHVDTQNYAVQTFPPPGLYVSLHLFLFLNVFLRYTLILTWPSCCSRAVEESQELWCWTAWPRGLVWTPSSQLYGGPGRRREAGEDGRLPFQWTAVGSKAHSPCSREAERYKYEFIGNPFLTKSS